MTRYGIAYVAILVLFVIVDFAWLGTVGRHVYRPVLGDILLEKPILWAAAVFYLLYAAGVVVFAVTPALRLHSWQMALLLGALFGFFAYMTYDLSNMATLRGWSAWIVVVDILWGTLLTGVCSALAYLIVQRAS